jgi:hypothetical protein
MIGGLIIHQDTLQLLLNILNKEDFAIKLSEKFFIITAISFLYIKVKFRVWSLNLLSKESLTRLELSQNFQNQAYL